MHKKLKIFESEGEFVAPEDQGINFMRTIQTQSAQAASVPEHLAPITRTNDAFFVDRSKTSTCWPPRSSWWIFFTSSAPAPR